MTEQQREEAFRRKERELGKREQQIVERQQQVDSARATVDALLQELEARELVILEAESKHGSLLRREEDAIRREKDLSERERQLNDRNAEVLRLERDLEEASKLRDKQYQERLYPLATREQELNRREVEVHNSEIELESKMRSVSKKVQLEEEKDRAKEKSFREQEARLKDMAAKNEKRNQEAEAQLASLAERSKQIKSEQVELETRDREVKWKEEQLRLATNEVHETKRRLMEWEKSLDIKREESETILSEVQNARSAIDVKELELSERLNKLLGAESDLQQREQALHAREVAMMKLEEASGNRAHALTEANMKLREQLSELDETKADLEAKLKLILMKEEDHEKKAAALLEREGALKNWILELDFRESTLNRKENMLMNAASTGTGAVASNGPARLKPIPAKSASEVLPHRFNAGLVQMQLQQLQNAYIGAALRREQNNVMQRDAERKGVDLLDLRRDEYTALLEAETVAVEMEEQVGELEKELNHFTAKYFTLTAEQIDECFAESERQMLITVLEKEDDAREETAFLAAISATHPTSVADLNNKGSSAQNALYQSLMKWHAGIRQYIADRRKAILAGRLSRLTEAREMFVAKTSEFPSLFPDYKMLLEAAETNSLKQQRRRGSHNLRSAMVRRAGAPLAPMQSSPEPAAATSTNAGTAEPPQQPSVNRNPKPRQTEHKANDNAVLRKADVERLMETLPKYLRKHYEEYL